MRKFLVLLVTLLLCVSLSACSSSNEEEQIVKETVEKEVVVEEKEQVQEEIVEEKELTFQELGLEAGLYDEENNLLCPWVDTGIDIEKDLGDLKSDNSVFNVQDCAYYVITNSYPNTAKVVIPDGVTHIGSEQFDGTKNIIDIAIPDSVTSIGDYTFQNLNLTYLYLPENVTTLGEASFVENVFETIVVDPGNPSFTSQDENGKELNGIFTKDLKTLVLGCRNTIIPEGVEEIGISAFFHKEGYDSIHQIKLPSTLTSIGPYAFYRCYNLSAIDIPDSVTSIGEQAFYDCNFLKEVKLSESLTSIGQYAFYGCYSLVDIKIPASLKKLSYCMFYNCNSLQSVEFLGDVEVIEDCCFADCSSLSLTIPNSVKSVGEYACLRIPHVEYHGNLAGAPWYADSLN